MNPERLEALLWERIDGTITENDLAKLEAAIARDPAAQRVEREVARIAEELDELPKMAPPSHLKAQIGAALAHTTVAGHSASDPPVVRNRRWTARPNLWLPIAASLLIGVAVGYLLPTLGGGAIDESQVVGTMGATTAPQERQVTIDLDGGLGTVVVSRGGTSTTVELNLAPEVDVMLTLEQPGEMLEINALDDTGGLPTTVSTAGGIVVLRSRGPGGPRLGVTTGEGPAPLRIEVTADGAVVAERWIGLPEAGDHS